METRAKGERNVPLCFELAMEDVPVHRRLLLDVAGGMKRAKRSAIKLRKKYLEFRS